MVQKFFNRSPITLKFGAEKLERERESRKSERERERERASCCIYVRKWLLFYTRKLMFFCKLLFYACNLAFYTLGAMVRDIVSWSERCGVGGGGGS